jgi:hypothetical protein
VAALYELKDERVNVGGVENFLVIGLNLSLVLELSNILTHLKAKFDWNF